MATPEQIIRAIVWSVPHVHQIKAFDFSETDAIRFTWRGTTYRVASSGFVEEVGDGVLIGSNLAILMAALIEPTLARIVAEVEP